MKTLSILLVGIIIAGKTVAGTFQIPVNNSYNNIDIKKDSSNWVVGFTAFRNAIATNDRNKLKSFFDFPLLSDNSDLWYLITQGENQDEEKMALKEKPFTEKDFDKYYDKLFPVKFKTSIAQLKLENLQKKGECESPAFKASNTTTYKMYASVDKTEMTLSLSVGFRTVIKDKKGKIESAEEYGTVYVFSILKNGQLKFKKIMMTA